MTECSVCGASDWTYFHCEHGGVNYLIEACRECTAVRAEGLMEQLTENITEQIKGELVIEVQLESIEDKITRIDETLQAIWSYLNSEEE